MKFKKSLALLALSQLPIFSATFNVSTTLELRQALENVALNGENDTIILQPGTYSTVSDELGTFMFNDTEEYNLTIEGADGYSMNEIVLDGEGTHQVMNFTNSKPFTLKIKNLSIVNGKTESRGGGLYTTGDTIIVNTVIYNNYSDSYGSGFYSGGNTVIIDSNISYNNCQYGGGGFYSVSDTKIVNSIISYNNSEYNGGGFYSGGKTTITNTIISNNFNNRYFNGGGFYSDSDTKIVNSIILNNNSKYKGGGFYSGGKTTILDSNFSNNNASGDGGGFYSENDVLISNSNISNNNTSNDGGGFYSFNDVLISNSNIFNNSTKYDGGGFYSRNKTLIINSNIYNNYGSGFYSLKNSILINSNFINNSAKIRTYGVFINNIFINDGIDFRDDSKLYYNYINYGDLIENNHVIIKKSNLLPTIVGDINLADDNITLQSGSPAIDAGLNPTDDLFKNAFDDEETYAKVLEYLKTDYFGNERIVNGKIDLGASEYDSKNAINENAPKLSIVLSGDQKVYYPITINFNIETPNTISELYIDKGNGYESVATTLRSFTVTYNSAGEYTVKVKAVDDQGNVAEVTKSINVYNLTTQEAIEYGKKLCQEDPASCGIETSSTAIEVKDMIFETPKDQIRNVLTLQSTYNVAGYFIHYSDPNSKNPAFDWIFITPSMAAFKLQGMKSDGSFSWSENLADQFSGIKLSNDGKFITFEK